MAQEVGKLFRVKKQVQGVVPSTQNSEYFELINLGGNGNVDQSAVVNTYKEDTNFKIDDILVIEEEIDENILFGAKAPIPPYYIQFAKDDGSFDENEEPSNWYKKQYGIETEWEIKFNGDSVYFRTEGGLANDSRINGIQGDAGRNATGYIWTAIGGSTCGGCFYSESTNNLSKSHGTTQTPDRVGFNLSLAYTIANEFRTVNRLIRVYHLLNVELTANYYLGQFAIPPFYTVYPESDGTFDDAKRPTNFYKNLYGVNTVWELIHNDGSFFRSIGGPSDDRSNGLQGDAIRNITGSKNYAFDRYEGGTDGCFHHTTNPVDLGFAGNDRDNLKLIFDASRVVPTSSENRPKNREIEIYKLKSINGIAV